MTDFTWPTALPALITPFTESGEVDIDAHHHNVSLMAERGCKGVLIGGSTGEGPLLEPGDRRILVAEARRAAPAMTVICGVNAESTRQAISQITEGAAGGAHSALVLTPTTVSRNRIANVERFYGEVAEEASLPILLYTAPGVTGWVLPTESVNRLAPHPNILGIKDSVGEPDRLDAYADLIESGFVVYAGTTRALLESGKRGAHGAITASSNYALTEVGRAMSGDGDAQKRMTELSRIVEVHGVTGTKFAASLVGLRPGHPRSPLSDIGPDAQNTIIEALAGAGLG